MLQVPWSEDVPGEVARAASAKDGLGGEGGRRPGEYDDLIVIMNNDHPAILTIINYQSIINQISIINTELVIEMMMIWQF